MVWEGRSREAPPYPDQLARSEACAHHNPPHLMCQEIGMVSPGYRRNRYGVPRIAGYPDVVPRMSGNRWCPPDVRFDVFVRMFVRCCSFDVRCSDVPPRCSAMFRCFFDVSLFSFLFFDVFYILAQHRLEAAVLERRKKARLSARRRDWGCRAGVACGIIHVALEHHPISGGI